MNSRVAERISDIEAKSSDFRKELRTRNNAFIPELADDPALVAWLDSVGLEVTEAARIQPSYDGNRVSGDFALATLALGGGSLAATTVNVVAPSLVSEVAGVLLGGAAIVLGVSHLDQNHDTRRVANASIVLGGVSLAASVGAFIITRTIPHAGRSSAGRDKAVSRLMIAPAILTTSSAHRLGLAARASF